LISDIYKEEGKRDKELAREKERVCVKGERIYLVTEQLDY